MANHVRQQIREAAATAVTGLTTSGARVYQSRVYPLDDSKLPCLLVNTDDETVTDRTDNAPSVLSRSLTLIIKAVARQAADLDDKLDTMVKEVETALGDSVLGGLVKSLNLEGLEIEMSGETEKPSGIATMKFTATYFTVANTPTTAL